MLIAIDTEAGGIVACGYEDKRQGETIVASEFQIFRCDGGGPLLELGALQTAALHREADVLRVTELEQWPFGKGWQWVQVPVYEWHLSAGDPRPELRRTLEPALEVTQAEIDAFLNEYRQWLSIAENVRSYDSAEEYVARLFTSAVAGDGDAKALFRTMRDDVRLDGAVAEIYGQAARTHNAWQDSRSRLHKH